MDYARARRNMIESQIRVANVDDPVILQGLEELPREAFLPDPAQPFAYLDDDVPVGGGRALMEPRVAAMLAQYAQVKETDAVLNIGCGVGFEAALLARAAKTVIGLESDPALAERARAAFAALGIDAVRVVEGPLQAGWPAEAPYDVIFFSGAIEAMPPAICDQLAEGGRIAAVIAEHPRVGRARLYLKTGGVVSSRVVFDATVTRLPGFGRSKA